MTPMRLHFQLLRSVLLLLCLGVPSAVLAQGGDNYLPSTCKNPYSQNEEVALGGKVVQQVYSTMPVLPDTDPTAVYVRQLGQRLVAAAPLTPGLEQQWPFNFHVVASSEINAFALPGGAMFVNLGAIQAAQTEAQLAGVMAHEMSHVVLRHSTCNLVKQQHRSILYSLGQIGAAAVLGGAGGDLAAQGIGIARNLNFLKMSRGDEEQADKLGVHIMHDANLDPRGLPQFFEIILAKTGSGGQQFLSDHPNPGNRMEYLGREIAGMSPLAHPTVTTAAFTAAHQQAATEHALTDAEMKSGAWRSSGLYASSPGAAAAARPVSSAAPAAAGGSAAGAAGSRANGGIAPLSAAQLGLSGRLVRYQAGRYAISRPANWTASEAGGAGSTTLAPPGGSGSFGVAYGVVLGVESLGGNGISDAATLQQASDAFAGQFAQAHGLVAQGAASTLTVAGQPATARYLSGASPVGGGAERDWLVTVARPDGDLCTLLFVAPASQFGAMEPLFRSMLGSFSPQ